MGFRSFYGAMLILIGVSMCHKLMAVYTYVNRQKPPPQTLDFTVDCLEIKAMIDCH